MISNIPYTLIPLPGLVTMSERSVQVLNSRHPDEAFFLRTIDKLLFASGLATRAIGSSRQAEGTKTVVAADDDRDASFDSVRDHVKAGLKRNNPEYKAACERLYGIFKKNNLNLSRLPYDEETGALISLFEDLSGSQPEADLAMINASEWLAELKRDQTAFENAVKARASEKKEVSEIPTDAVAKEALIPALKSFYRVIDVAEENEIVTGVSETIGLINVIIQEVVTAHRR